jgi:3-oxoacyl-[acyl-carrier protein] reductase
VRLAGPSFGTCIPPDGRLDILVNNAGVYEFAPLESVTEELFHRQFNVNVLGLLLTTNSTVYATSKAAVDAITGVLSKELGPRNIPVNSINPGMIETEGTHAGGLVGSDFQKTIETLAPLGRMGQPDDIWPMAVYLASSDSKYMTGETLLVSGGIR